MTLRTLYRPSLLTRPIPLSRGWQVLGLAVLAWLAFVYGGYGLFMLVGGVLP